MGGGGGGDRERLGPVEVQEEMKKGSMGQEAGGRRSTKLSSDQVHRTTIKESGRERGLSIDERQREAGVSRHPGGGVGGEGRGRERGRGVGEGEFPSQGRASHASDGGPRGGVSTQTRGS